jgi:lipid A 4'-phosphatase
MRYLRLRRSRTILAWFAVSSLLLTAFPSIDLYVSGIFFQDGFHLSRQWWTTFMHESMGYLLCFSIAAVLGVYVYNKLWKRSLCGVDEKRVVYLLLVLIIGAGLIVNGMLKANTGRARPRDVVEFGGSKLYTPPFVLSRECDRNCSFSSGEAAGGFFALALALALSTRRRMFISAVGFGSFVSFCRVASGAHFFSDTVVSFFVMLIVADVLYYYLLSPEIGVTPIEIHARESRTAPRSAAGTLPPQPPAAAPMS